jgi:hypothetical protein
MTTEIVPVREPRVYEEDGYFFLAEAYASYDIGHPVCGARSHRCRNCEHVFSKEEHDLWTCPECGEDRHCLMTVRQPGLRCRLHGGKTPGGLASPHIKTGDRSRYLPARLAQHYLAAENDPHLLSLRNDIALMDTRLIDLLGRVDTGEAGRHWAKLNQAWTEFKRAKRRDDDDALAIALDNLEQLITTGHADYTAWAEIAQAVEQRRKLVESERRTLVDLQQMITAERATKLIAAFTGIVKEYVDDRRTFNAIAADIRKLIGDTGGRPA